MAVTAENVAWLLTQQSSEVLAFHVLQGAGIYAVYTCSSHQRHFKVVDHSMPANVADIVPAASACYYSAVQMHQHYLDQCLECDGLLECSCQGSSTRCPSCAAHHAQVAELQQLEEELAGMDLDDSSVVSGASTPRDSTTTEDSSSRSSVWDDESEESGPTQATPAGEGHQTRPRVLCSAVNMYAVAWQQFRPASCFKDGGV